MKKTKGVRLLALVLVLTMMAPGTAYAAPGRWSNNSWANQWKKQSSSSNRNTTSNKNSAANKTTTTTETEMEVVESAETVENPEMLRATTYELTTTETTTATGAWGVTRDVATTSDTTVLKYFNATLYDYDKDTINAATHAADGDDAVYEGIYFINSDEEAPYTKETKTDLSAFVAGEYYIQNIRASQYIENSWLKSVTYNGIVGESIQGTTKDNATIWTLVIEDGEYYLMSKGKYLVIGNGGAGEKLSDTKTAIKISAFSGDSRGVQLSQNDNYLCQWWDRDDPYIYYGGYGENNDAGNGMLFYPVGSNGPITPGESSEEKIISGYEEWNRWDKAYGNGNVAGDLFYTGLVKSTLDANKDIVFTKPDGGIFNSDSSVKSIYPGVEIPYLYEDGYYTFDASQNGVYLYEDAKQKSTKTASVTVNEETGDTIRPRLYFDDGNPQENGLTYGDQSSTMWMPLVNKNTLNGEGDCNYHFGMRTTIPFSMTPNGRIDFSDDKSNPITFSFSGDDDVWVFIDGHLVIDLGGIHNRLNADIDFAANTVKYWENTEFPNDNNNETASYNDSNFETTQTLFGNLIPQDRSAFASTPNHELTIFYLERGAGSSNCKISFNLPVNDTVTVTKDATKSWNEETNKVTLLTAEEQEKVNANAFGFTLYRKLPAETEFSAVTNERFYLINENGQVVETRNTDANGRFELHNGQSARFITTAMDNAEGVSYYVEEEVVAGFTQPDYNYGGVAAGKADTGAFYYSLTDMYYATGSDIPELEVFGDSSIAQSGVVTVYGAEEADDSLEFICSNFLDAALPNPSIRPVNEKIVIDYGLPVEIDVLKNDLWRSDSVELLKVTGEGMSGSAFTIESADTMSVQQTIAAGTAPFNTMNDLYAVNFSGNDLKYGTAEIVDVVDKNGKVVNQKIVYTLNKPLTGVEVLNYLVKVSGTALKNSASDETVTVYEYAIATVYIIPATSMYYEEDFTGLVTYTDGAASWQPAVVEAEYQSDFQEPGVVGTIGDSPYGSDVAYLSDSKDSNGTSRYADTTNGSVKFSYEFTGTGTSFFGRTGANSGYMRVIVKDVDGEVQQDLRRSTIYKAVDGTDVGTLYNIPIYTFIADNYGTYTVEVEVMKALPAVNRGKDFYLDGIRVMNPLNAQDSNKEIAKSAYITDAEANNSVATLREKILGESQINEDGTLSYDGDKFVVFTDSNGAITSVEEYRSNGPKEEVYLNNGQSISFAMQGKDGWDTEANRIYLGAKAPLGSGSITINGRPLELSNAADCYYDITDYAKIATDAVTDIKTATFDIQSTSSLVSLTNIKVTGAVEFIIVENDSGSNDNPSDETVDDENGDENEDIVAD